MSAARRVAALVLAAGGVWWLWPAPGTVTDAQGPVAGAVVRYQGRCCAALSNRSGRFQLPPGTPHSKRITAWKTGYAIASIPAGSAARLQLLPLPTEDNDDYEWVDPAPDPQQPHNCGNCHAEIYREWSGSAHATSATNPRVHSVFAAVARDRPDDVGVCAKCHAPTMRDPVLDYDLRTVKGIDVHGVHCDYCHKVIDAPLGKFGTRFGSDGLRILRPAKGQMLFFGPLDDAVRDGEQFGHSPVYKESRYCASCHEGVIYGVHVYGTYSEWLDSPARQQGQQCQTCHMTPTGKMTNIAPGNGGIERDPRTLASHGTPGGTKEMLKRCLSVKAVVNGKRVDVEVKADNVGHRVPTGFPGRQLELVVIAQDAKGGIIDVPRSKVYAKQFRAALPGGLTDWWRDHEEMVDTRLFPGQVDRVTVLFSRAPAKVHVRLRYRRERTIGQPVYDAGNADGITVVEEAIYRLK